MTVERLITILRGLDPASQVVVEIRPRGRYGIARYDNEILAGVNSAKSEYVAPHQDKANRFVYSVDYAPADRACVLTLTEDKASIEILS